MKRTNLYERAINHYGSEAQMTMAIEEMSELRKRFARLFVVFTMKKRKYY